MDYKLPILNSIKDATDYGRMVNKEKIPRLIKVKDLYSKLSTYLVYQNKIDESNFYKKVSQFYEEAIKTFYKKNNTEEL